MNKVLHVTSVGKTEEHENSGFGMWTVPSPSCYAPAQGRHCDEPKHRLGARLSEFKGLFDEARTLPTFSENTHSHDIPTPYVYL